MQSGKEPLEPWVVVERMMKFPVSDSLLAFVRSLSRSGSSASAGSVNDSGVFYDAATGRLFANVPESRRAQVIAFLEAADVPGRQVTVEACIVLASLGSGQDFGVEWLAGWGPGRAALGSGSVSIGSGVLTISAGQFGLALQNAVDSRTVSVLSRPSVGCRLGGTAEISSGRQVGIVSTSSLDSNVVSSVDFKDVALSLAVQVTANGAAFAVDVDQRNDELGGSVVVEGKPIPEISTQRLKTSLLLDAGRWASAGSVVVERDASSRSGFRLLPASNRSVSSARQEIGVFIRVVDGLVARQSPSPAPVAVSEPAQFAAALRAVPVEAAKNPIKPKRRLWSPPERKRK